jgi:hypothetical protein
MTKFGLIGAAALSLVLATPAMAMHRHHHHYHYFTLTEPTTTSPAETPLTNSLQGSVGGRPQTNQREEYRRVIERRSAKMAGRTPTFLICAVIDRNSKSLSSTAGFLARWVEHLRNPSAAARVMAVRQNASSDSRLQ